MAQIGFACWPIGPRSAPMAWVEKRPHGWVVRWRDEHGKHTDRAYGAKRDAQDAAEEFEARVAPVRRHRLPGQRPIAPLTITQIVDLWRTARMDDEERMRRPGAQTYLDTATERVKAVADRWRLPSRAARPGDVTVEQATRLRKRDGRTSASVRAVLRWAQGVHGTPLDPRVDVALRPAPSRKESKERLTDRQAKAALARARRLGQLPLISCLMVYGWRPITACRLNVGDVDLRGGRISLAIKHDGEPWWHPLFAFHVKMLRPLVDGRAANCPLFVPPQPRMRLDGTTSERAMDRWAINKGGSAAMLAVWIRRNVLGVDGSKQLKKLAISRMRAGEWPWRQPMSGEDVRRFTGQKSDAIVARYEQTNMQRSRSLMAEGQ